MSVRQSVLALLAQGPRHGALLKADFEARTGGTWELNVGQVYTTLARLERDGLVVGDPPDEEGRIVYRLTPAGQTEAAAWWHTPVSRGEPVRDELVIKLALAVCSPSVDPYAVLRTQRAATMSHLQQLTRRKLGRLTDQPGTMATRQQAGGATRQQPRGADQQQAAERLLLEHRLFAVEAELRWLDHVEATLNNRPVHPTTTGEHR